MPVRSIGAKAIQSPAWMSPTCLPPCEPSLAKTLTPLASS